jgi:translation elongation factor EF-1beta
MRVMAEDDERSVKELVHEVRQRVERRTFIQDVSEPLTGRIDQRKIAAKFNNLEHAVDELAEAVERVADEKSA